jgi:hypothetical protein
MTSRYPTLRDLRYAVDRLEKQWKAAFGYHARRWYKMRDDYGTLDAMRRLFRPVRAQDGFNAVPPTLTLEFLATSQFAYWFSKAELDVCHQRLARR